MSDENSDSRNDASRAKKKKKTHKRLGLQKQMAVCYTLTAHACHAARPNLQRVFIRVILLLLLPSAVRNILLFSSQDGGQGRAQPNASSPDTSE